MHLEFTRIGQAFAVSVLVGTVGTAAFAVPPDPTRPLAAQTCDRAMARLIEAEAGSPLISADQQAQVLSVAQADVARLCGANKRNGPRHLPTIPHPPQIPDVERVHVGPTRAVHPTLFDRFGTARYTC